MDWKVTKINLLLNFSSKSLSKMFRSFSAAGLFSLAVEGDGDSLTGMTSVSSRAAVTVVLLLSLDAAVDIFLPLVSLTGSRLKF